MKRILQAFCLFLALALLPVAALCDDQGKCLYVIDGDTIFVEGIGKVRLLGVDTPELGHGKRRDEPGAREAKRFTKEKVNKKMVRLAYDHQRKDKYGRTLAYVYTLEGFFLNEELLKNGLAEPVYRFEYKLKDRFIGLKKSR